MDPELHQICATHGVFLRREATTLGYDDHAIDRLVRGREWHRVRWGAYTFEEIWEHLDARARYGLLCRAAFRRAQTEVALSHVSSLHEWAAPLWGLDLSYVHLTRRDGKAGRKEAGIAQHRGKVMTGDWVEHNGVFVMSPTRTALEITMLTDVEHALVAMDDLVHRGLTSPDQLEARYAMMDHWPDTMRTDLALRLLDGRSESVGETRIRYLCWSQHLPAPIPNFPIRDSHGHVIHRVDLAWPELGLYLEFDGKEKYLRHRRPGESVTDCVLREKRREDRISELTGWRCIRVTWADLYSPEQTAARIRTMFSARPGLLDGQRLNLWA